MELPAGQTVIDFDLLSPLRTFVTPGFALRWVDGDALSSRD